MSMTVHLFLKANGEDIQGESSQTTLDREDTIECFSFEYACNSGSEQFSGKASGYRNYEPISIVKRIDKSTPLLWRALTLNHEIEGEFRFYRPDPAGKGVTEHFYTVKIAGGRVSDIHFESPDAMVGGSSGEPPTEVVKFVYNNMIQTYVPSGAEHEDNFSTSA